MTHPISTSKISFSPIAVKFVGKQQTLIKEVTDDLTSKWKNQHVLDPNKWSRALKEVNIDVKVPRQLPPEYSLVIQQFHRNWNEDEWLTELEQLYVSLYKITGMQVKVGSPLNAVRTDFESIEEVKTLIRSGKINVGSMIYPVQSYHLPIRINKCFRHDRTTKNCTRS
ncbi:unnamed protein product [Rotaria sp. Silwood2]|nr:unnamed protein product [Rotaria sp. Silwood2]CAF3038471.1 unnamed protein product [Rotaria sp. Silwood2]CAF3389044.1 unnamed protein product [Rotaria sp. Silwood2]CAF4227111.1 unnamed protein product [Rotaria sp. Silwood2]CAF4338508.1 unnamed protein product [Rotaria sp. Silwood2]